MYIQVDSSQKMPMYLQIIEKVKLLIEQKILEVDQALPSTRKLANKLGVNRSTVTRAYEELQALGYLYSKPGAYHRVRERHKEIDYDPDQITYHELLEVFWKSHSPTSRPLSRQYRSILFYHDEDQKRFALETRHREAANRNARLYTEIAPYTVFYLAEDYHQKYRLQHEQDLMGEFRRMFPHMADLINSTAAARVNGYLAGYGTSQALEEVIDSLGLSEAGVRKLRQIVAARDR